MGKRKVNPYALLQKDAQGLFVAFPAQVFTPAPEKGKKRPSTRDLLKEIDDGER